MIIDGFSNNRIIGSLLIDSLTIIGPLLTGSSSRTIVSSSMIVGSLMIIGSLLIG